MIYPKQCCFWSTEDGSHGLSKLLQFMTGLSQIPPLGLQQPIQLEFTAKSMSFFAETCTYVLRVPNGHASFDSFMEKIREACDNSLGFACS